LAGMVSDWNFEQETIPESRKYQQVLTDVIASNSNVHLVRLILKWENDRISANSQSIAMSRNK
jgi:hypothetical protein